MNQNKCIHKKYMYIYTQNILKINNAAYICKNNFIVNCIIIKIHFEKKVLKHASTNDSPPPILFC